LRDIYVKNNFFFIFLLIGMGKSQLLLSASQIASRSIYVGGNTSSTTGLTASLSKETGGEVGIEAGALVLADQGNSIFVCYKNYAYGFNL